MAPKGLIITALLLVVTLITVSAYLRLSGSGLGCPGWPECYGNIGHSTQTAQENPARQYTDRLMRDLSQPGSWATPVHRISASALAIIIAIITFQTYLHRKQGAPLFITIGLLVLTLLLAILGISSGGLHLPVIVLGNLTGGFAMLALLWLLYLKSTRRNPPRQHAPVSGYWLMAGILLLISQIVLGALTSANFAALACTSFPDCHGQWWPGQALWQSFNIFTPVEVDDSGKVIAHMGQQALHILHRLGALANLLVLGGIALATLRAQHRFRGIAILILTLLLLEIAIGIATVLLELPVSLTVAHNSIAALLLLGLLSLYYRTRPVS